MSNELKDQLAALHAELGRTRSVDPQQRQLLADLLGDITRLLRKPGAAQDQSVTGRLDELAVAVREVGPSNIGLVFGLVFIIVGVAFKFGAVPFHMWIPDVYHGAPTPVTLFVGSVPKIGSFVLAIRVLAEGLDAMVASWQGMLIVLAVLSMAVGNIVAIAQSNLKRMLAYSSIAHVGYMLVGVVAGGAPGAGAVLFYLLAYTFTTVGTFGVITLCERAGEEAVDVGDYAGLARRHPVLAATLALFLLSLVGIPPLAGFVGKFYLFGAAVRSGYLWLAVLGVLNSAVAAYYYLRVIVYMYMREPDGASAPAVYAPSFAGGLALVISLAGIVLLGLMPAPFVDLAQSAVAPLLR